jgi:hypothetical protein
LNLRRNPFEELAPEAWARVAVVDTAGILAALGPGRAVELVGRCGRGKTTHLLALAAARPDATYVRLRRDPIPERAGLLLVDEADAIGPIGRHRLYRGADSLVLATHRSLALGLRLAGFAVQTRRVGVSTPDDLAVVLRRRIEAARAGEGALPSLEAEAVRHLGERFGDDLRAMEELLYARFARLDAARPLTARDLC